MAGRIIAVGRAPNEGYPSYAPEGASSYFELGVSATVKETAVVVDCQEKAAQLIAQGMPHTRGIRLHWGF